MRARAGAAVREAAAVAIASASVVAAAGAAWLYATRAAGAAPVVHLVAWTLAGGVVTALLARLMSPTFRSVVPDRAGGGRVASAAGGDDAEPAVLEQRGAEATGPAAVASASADEVSPSLGLPNALTLVRFILIAPTVVLLDARRYDEALVCYALLFATDVADGIVARRRGLASEFGVVADPVADVASTWAVFSVFWLQDLCPGWLYGLLVARYAMLILGSFGIFLATGPIPFRATVPGKIVGVVQAIGACLIMATAARGGLGSWAERALFAVLGIGFASIVVSQAVIGWKLIRRR